MNFLYPQFLFGLLAISIPIAIHLFNLQKPKKVFFTNVQFLQEVKETTSSRLKLKHLLILLSRIFFILFLVLTFAQPFLKGNKADSLKGATQVSVYLDNSYSMQNELDQEKAIDIAVKSVSSLSEIYPATTKFNLVTNDFEGKDQFFKTKDKIQERLTEIKLSNTYRDVASVISRQVSTLSKTGKDNNHIFLFSDFQKSTLGDFEKTKFDSSCQYYIVPIQNKEVSNVYIDSIWLESPLVKIQENNSLEVQLVNDGTKEVSELLIKLYIDEVQVSTASITLPPKSVSKAKFAFSLNTEGEKKCRIHFEDHPVTFDNDYYFVLNVSPKIKILHLKENSGEYLNTLFSNESIFSITSSHIGDFDYSAISNSNLIILENLKNIPSALTEPIRAFVNQGGSLVIFPAVNPDITSYNEFLRNLSGPSLSKSTVDTSAGKNSVQLLPPDLNNPFYANVFEKTTERMNTPFAYPLLSWLSKGDALLKYKNDLPFLSLYNKEKGKIYMFATGLQDGYTNFHKHSLFVPVMYKVAFNSVVKGENLAYSFQQSTISLNLDIKDKNTIYTLAGEDLKIIPSQRIIGSQLLLEVPKEEIKAGFYELQANGETAKLLAFNYGKSESVLDFYNKEDFQKLAGSHKNVHVYDIDSSDGFLSEFKAENVGVSLWKYCLILCLIFLLVEILLIRFL